MKRSSIIASGITLGICFSACQKNSLVPKKEIDEPVVKKGDTIKCDA